MKKKRYKTVAGLVRNTTSTSFQKLFAKTDRERKALIAKYANDPKHKHVRELVGEVAHVWPGKRKVLHRLYWCKICHADMDEPANRKRV